DVGDQALVIALDGVVGRPARRGAPVPVKHVLSPLAIPVPLNGFPEGIGACSQLLFLFITLLEVLPYANQCLRHKGGFYEISSVVIFTERLGLARWPIQPMWPRPVEPAGFFEIADYLLKPLQPFVPRDELPLDANQQRHQAKAAAADGNDLLIVLRVFAIDMNTLTGEA